MSARDFTMSPQLGRGLERLRQRSLIVGLVALLACIVGALFRPDQFFRSYLFAYMFYIGLTIGCMAVVMLQYLTGGAWGLVIRRTLEAATRTLPLLLLLFVPIAIGLACGLQKFVAGQLRVQIGQAPKRKHELADGSLLKIKHACDHSTFLGREAFG